MNRLNHRAPRLLVTILLLVAIVLRPAVAKSATAEAAGPTRRVLLLISDVGKGHMSAAAAIEEQSVATRDIAGNVAQASQGLREVNVNVAESSTVIREISREIGDVSSASESTQQSTDEVARKAEELRVLASNLFALLGRFRT